MAQHDHFISLLQVVQQKMDTLTPLYPINHQLILIKGPDAKKFLQGQVTCDVDELDNTLSTQTSAPLGAHCTHKGRVVFSFRALQLPKNSSTSNEQIIALSVPQNIADIAVAALKKYSVFSKVDILPMSEEYQLLGMCGDDAYNRLLLLADEHITVPTELNMAIHTSIGSIICVAKNSYELWLTKEQAQGMEGKITNILPADNTYWHERTVKSGIASIYKDTSTLFTPHEMNYQQIGNAVSFKKGCYTGQEVVARMHYLGKLKKQLFLFELITAEDGTQVVSNGPLYIREKDQPVGTIIDVSKHQDHYYFLASVVTDHAHTKDVFLDLAHQHPVRLLTPDT